LKFGMVITRLTVFARALSRDLSDRHQRHAISEEFRQSNLFGLEGCVRKLDAEGNSKTLALRGVQRKLPNRFQIEPARARLNISPIATDVENIDKREAGNF